MAPVLTIGVPLVALLTAGAGAGLAIFLRAQSAAKRCLPFFSTRLAPERVAEIFVRSVGLGRASWDEAEREVRVRSSSWTLALSCAVGDDGATIGRVRPAQVLLDPWPRPSFPVATTVREGWDLAVRLGRFEHALRAEDGRLHIRRSSSR